MLGFGVFCAGGARTGHGRGAMVGNGWGRWGVGYDLAVFFPLSTNRRLTRPSVVTPALIAANVLAYAFMAFHVHGDRDLAEVYFDQWGFSRLDRPLGLLTSLFVHADMMHLLGNMVFLWVFGPSVEDRLGRVGMVAFYLVAGVVASLGWYAVEGGVPAVDPTLPPMTPEARELYEQMRRQIQQAMGEAVGIRPSVIVGASGAIAGVTGAYLVLFPRTVVRVFVVFFFIGMYEIPALWFVAASFLMDIYLQARGSGGVAHSAHISGSLFGAAVAMGLLGTGILRREDFDLFFWIKHKRRQAEIRAAVLSAQQERSARVTASRTVRPDDDTGMSLRAAVAEAVAREDWAGGAAALRTFAGHVGSVSGRLTVSRRIHMQLANGLFGTGMHKDAGEAYERFLMDHPADAEGPHVRLLLALLRIRYLGQAGTAAELLAGLEAKLTDPEDGELLKQLREEIAPAGS